jgi:hypothetical protein
MTRLQPLPLIPFRDPAEEEAGLLRRIGHVGGSGLSSVGNLLDLPSSVLRDLASSVATRSFVNPLDQFLHPFSHSERGLSVAGRDLGTQLGLMAPNKATGLRGWLDDPMEAVRDIGGFATEVLLDIPGYGLAKKALQGVGKAARTAPIQDATSALLATSGGQRLRGAADAAKRRVMDPIADYSLAAFSKPVLEGLGPEGRALGRRVSSASEQARAGALKTSAPMLEAWGRFISPLRKQYATYGLDAKQIARQEMEIDTALRDYIEFNKPLPDSLAGLEDVARMGRDLNFADRDLAASKGVPVKWLDDIIEHTPRRRNRLEGDPKASTMGRGSRLLKASDEATHERLPFTRGLWEGTGIIQRLSVDPRFSGIAHAMKPGAVTPEFWKRHTKMLQDELELGGHNQTFENTGDLARWLANLNPEHARQGIPVYATNVVDEIARRHEALQEAMAMADTMQETLVGRAFAVHRAPPGTVSAREAFIKAGLDPDVSLTRLHTSQQTQALKERFLQAQQPTADVEMSLAPKAMTLAANTPRGARRVRSNAPSPVANVTRDEFRAQRPLDSAMQWKTMAVKAEQQIVNDLGDDGLEVVKGLSDETLADGSAALTWRDSDGAVRAIAELDNAGNVRALSVDPDPAVYKTISHAGLGHLMHELKNRDIAIPNQAIQSTDAADAVHYIHVMHSAWRGEKLSKAVLREYPEARRLLKSRTSDLMIPRELGTGRHAIR